MDEEVFNEEEKCIYQKSHFEDKEDFMANLEIIIQNKASVQDCSKALVRLGDVVKLFYLLFYFRELILFFYYS